MLHIIHKHKIILKLREEKGAWKLQDRVSNLYSTNLAQLLEPIFDSASSNEDYIRIEKLDLDLGNIRQGDFESHFKERLLSEFSKALGEAKHSSSENVKVVKRNQSNLDSFIFFLEYGYLPWYSNFEGFGNWETKLKLSLTSTDWNYFLKWLEKEIENSSATIDRLIFQFSDDFLSFLTNQIQGGKDFTIAYFNDIVSLLTVLSNENRTSLRFNTWKITIAQFVKTNNKEDTILEIIKSSVPISNIPYILNSNIPDWRRKIKKILSSNPSEDSIVDMVVSLIISAKSGTEILAENLKGKKKPTFYIKSGVVKESFLKLIAEFAKAGNLDENNIPISDKELPESEKKDETISSRKNIIDKKNSPASGELPTKEKKVKKDGTSSSVKNIIDKKNSLGSEELPTKEEQVTKGDSSLSEKKNIPDKNNIPVPPTPLTTKKQGKKDLVLEKAGILVSNCGIVLLHPFLKAYFTGLEIYSNNTFSTIENQQRAVLLLNYLATGHKEVAEVELVFQKLLCGMEIDEPVPNTIELTDKEVAESENLLHAVINHWAPLNRTSIAALQSTFFNREGKLTKADNGWRVFIENKTLDILLDKLPWGYSTIKLPWMKELLNVDWR